MMIRRTRMRHRVAAMVTSLALVACWEGLGPRGATLSAPSPRELVVQLTVEPTSVANEYIMRGGARAGKDVDAPSAFRATLLLPNGAVVIGDVAVGHAMLAVTNVVGDSVRIAGATPEVSGSNELFALRLRAPSIEALDGAWIDIHELVNAKGTDLRPTLRVISRPARVTMR
jgi:hypothetical protein